ncbi:MAG: conjugal transfer protein TraJ [Wolbachia endosymbiont of Fragariocoptes setiger]|nr:conjugal transfer protein TraJ [Wolbachia endosymbiont of Fragariocoptes setiger]
MNNQLFESVKNKSYFEKGINWYCERYLFCMTEKSWLLLIASFILLCVCILLLNIYLLLPIKKNINFVKYMDHTDDEFSIIYKVSKNEKEDEHISIGRHLIKKYIEVYESRQTLDSSYQIGFIRNNSIQKVYNSFQDKINNEMRNFSVKTRKVNNLNVVKLLINQLNKDLITYHCSATAVFTIEQNKDIKKQIVEIDFTISNIKKVLTNVTPFKFIVQNYKIR